MSFVASAQKRKSLVNDVIRGNQRFPIVPEPFRGAAWFASQGTIEANQALVSTKTRSAIFGFPPVENLIVIAACPRIAAAFDRQRRDFP